MKNIILKKATKFRCPQIKWFETLNANDKGCSKCRIPNTILLDYLETKRKNTYDYDLMVPR